MPLCVRAARSVEPLIVRCPGSVIGVTVCRIQCGKAKCDCAADDLESERLKRTHHTVIGRIDRKLGHGVPRERGSSGNGCLGHKRLQNRIVPCGSHRRRAKSLDVEGDGRAHVRQGSLVGVALPDDRAARLGQGGKPHASAGLGGWLMSNGSRISMPLLCCDDRH